MKAAVIITSLFILFTTSPSFSQENQTNKNENELTILVPYHSPPFTTTAGHKSFAGFDVSMMRYICKQLKTKCVFKPVPLGRILRTIELGEADMAVGGITITPERARVTPFSVPYLPGSGGFLTTQSTLRKYNNKIDLTQVPIGVIKGSVLKDIALSSGIPPANIEEYSTNADLVEALHEGDVGIVINDLAILNNWSIGLREFELYKKPFHYGYGYGIAIAPKNARLVIPINQALENFLAGPRFKDLYRMYFQKI